MDVEQYIMRQHYNRLSGRRADITTRCPEHLTPPYSPNVRLGNWYEDLCLREEQLKDYLDKREKGNLFIQKRQRLFESLLAPTQLTVSVDGLVHFGDQLLLLHPGLSDESPATPHTLAAYIGDDPFIAVPSKIPEDTYVFAISSTDPIVRNTFVIKGIGDKTPYGRPLTFGEPFQLSTVSDVGGDLLLYSARISFQEHSRFSNHQLVKLVKQESRFTQWRVLHVNPSERLETYGFPVPSNQRVVLNHIFTNQALALEWRHSLKTVLGLEYEVTAKTYLNVHKWESEPNQWLFGMPRRTNEQSQNSICQINPEPLSFKSGLVTVESPAPQGEVYEMASEPVKIIDESNTE